MYISTVHEQEHSHMEYAYSRFAMFHRFIVSVHECIYNIVQVILCFIGERVMKIITVASSQKVTPTNLATSRVRAVAYHIERDIE